MFFPSVLKTGACHCNAARPLALRTCSAPRQVFVTVPLSSTIASLKTSSSTSPQRSRLFVMLSKRRHAPPNRRQANLARNEAWIRVRTKLTSRRVKEAITKSSCIVSWAFRVLPPSSVHTVSARVSCFASETLSSSRHCSNGYSTVLPCSSTCFCSET